MTRAPCQCQSLQPREALLEAKQALLRGENKLARANVDVALCSGREQAAALRLLALAEAVAGHCLEAMSLLERALSLEPDQWLWRIDLATIYSAVGDWARAAEQFEHALQHNSEHIRGLEGYGQTLLELGSSESARRCFTRLAALQPGSRGPILGIARSYMGESRFNEAVTVLRRALVNDPASVEYLALLGEIYALCGKYEFARDTWAVVAELFPDNMEAIEALLVNSWKLGDLEATMAYCLTIIKAGRASEQLYSFFVYLHLFDGRETPESIRETCEGFSRVFCGAQQMRFKHRCEEADRKPLRIGYLTGEFTSGPPFYFLSSLLGNHDRASVELFLYHTRHKFDEQTEWYKRLGQWRDCREWDDETIHRQIRSDEIDILTDLSGFFPEHRLRIFAKRAAPVQATYPNCPVTTGIASIDYIFTDVWTCPRGSEDQYSEQVVRLPSGYLVYAPPPGTPPLSPLPAIGNNGTITFGLFQRRAKMNSSVWDAIADILRQCPRSRLLVHNGDPSLDDRNSYSRREITNEFSSREIDKGRLNFIGARNYMDALRTMARADIALDTFPFQGQTTTCECLWMGVPVVTLPGRAHVSRVGSAILQRSGFAELVAETQRDYITTALHLASDLDRLSRMRAGLRDRLAASSLLDGKRLARDVQAAYRWMWNNWCTQATPKDYI